MDGEKAVSTEQPRHAKNVRDPSRVLEQGPDRQRAPDWCSGGGLPSMEPPNPVAAWMSRPQKTAISIYAYSSLANKEHVQDPELMSLYSWQAFGSEHASRSVHFLDLERLRSSQVA